MGVPRHPNETNDDARAVPRPAPLTPVRVMVLTLAVLFVLGLVWLIVQVRSILLLLILGILLAAAIEPIVNRFRRGGLSRGQAILAVYAGIFALLAIVAYLIVPPLITQGSDLFNNAPQYLKDLRAQAAASANDFINTAGVRTIDRAIVVESDLRSDPPIQATQALGLVTSVVGVLFTTVSVMIVAFYWMTEKAIIKRLMLNLFPIERRDRAHSMWDRIEDKLGGWARGQLILMVVIGLLSAIAYSPPLLDLRFWFLLAIFAGVTELIPFIGPVLGGGLAFLVALTESWEKALIVAIFVIVLQQVEGSFLVPRVMRNAVGMTPLSVILAVLIGGALLGPLGAVLAIPVAAAVQVLVQDLLRSREEAIDTGVIGASVAATVTGHPTSVPGGGVAFGAGQGAPYAAVDLGSVEGSGESVVPSSRSTRPADGAP